MSTGETQKKAFIVERNLNISHDLTRHIKDARELILENSKGEDALEKQKFCTETLSKIVQAIWRRVDIDAKCSEVLQEMLLDTITFLVIQLKENAKNAISTLFVIFHWQTSSYFQQEEHYVILGQNGCIDISDRLSSATGFVQDSLEKLEMLSLTDYVSRKYMKTIGDLLHIKSTEEQLKEGEVTKLPIPLHHLLNVEHFCRIGGIRVLTNAIERGLDLHTLSQTLSIFLQFRSVLSIDTLKTIVLGLEDAVFTSLLALKGDDLRMVARENVNEVFAQLRALLEVCYTEEKLARIILSVRLQLGCKLLGCPYLQQRLVGLNQFCELIQEEERAEAIRKMLSMAAEAMSPTGNGSAENDSKKNASEMYNGNLALICSIMMEKNIVESVFGPDTIHSELVKRSVDIVCFLARRDSLSFKQLKLIWQAISGSGNHQPVQQESRNVLERVIQVLQPNRLELLWELVSATPSASFDRNTLSVIRTFTYRALEVCPVESRSQPGRDQWYGINLLWELVQDGGPLVPESVYEEGLEFLAELITSKLCRHFHLPRILSKCIENLESFDSIPQSLEILRQILISLGTTSIIPDGTSAHNGDIQVSEEKAHPSTASTLIRNTLATARIPLGVDLSKGLLPLCLAELEHFKGKCEEEMPLFAKKSLSRSGSFRGLANLPKMEDYHFSSSRYSFIEALKRRLKFVQYLAETWTKEQPSLPQLEKIWNSLIVKSLSPVEFDLCLLWFQDLHKALDDPNREMAKKIMLWPTSVPLDKLRLAAFNFVIYFIREVNVSLKNFVPLPISMQDNNSSHSNCRRLGFQIVHPEFVGKGMLWTLALESPDWQVSTRASTTLLYCYRSTPVVVSLEPSVPFDGARDGTTGTTSQDNDNCRDTAMTGAQQEHEAASMSVETSVAKSWNNETGVGKVDDLKNSGRLPGEPKWDDGVRHGGYIREGIARLHSLIPLLHLAPSPCADQPEKPEQEYPETGSVSATTSLSRCLALMKEFLEKTLVNAKLVNVANEMSANSESSTTIALSKAGSDSTAQESKHKELFVESSNDKDCANTVVDLKLFRVSASPFTLSMMRGDPVTKLRSQIASQINDQVEDKITPMNIRIITAGKEILDGHSIAEAGILSGQHIHVALRRHRLLLTTGSKDTPSGTVDESEIETPTLTANQLWEVSPNAILSEQSNFELLFKLLSLEDSGLVARVWDLLMAMPTNQQLLRTLKELELSETVTWSSIFSSSNILKLLYSLQIMNMLSCEVVSKTVGDAENQDTGKKDKAIGWCRKVVQAGGLEHLARILVTINFQSATHGKIKYDCLAMLLYVLNTLLSTVDQSVRMTTSPATWELLTSEEFQYKISQVLKLAGSDVGLDPHGLTVAIHVAQSSGNLLLSVASMYPSVLQWWFGKSSSGTYRLIEMFIPVSLESDNQSVRYGASLFAFQLCKMECGLSKSTDKSRGILQSLLASLKSIVSPASASKKSREFFFLLERLVKLCIHDSAREPLRSDIELGMLKQVHTVLRWYCAKQPESSPTVVDEVIQGLLVTLKELVSVSNELDSEEFLLSALDHVFYTILFEKPCSSQQNSSRRLVQSVNAQERGAAFELVLQLAQLSPACRESLVQKVCNIGDGETHDSPASTHTWPALATDSNLSSTLLEQLWRYDPMHMAKASCGFVGLRNMGCICYSNALMQQLFMIPKFRQSLLSVAHSNSSNGKGLLYQVQRLFGYLQESNRKYYDTNHFVTNSVELNGGRPLNAMEQQDAYEFFTVLMDQLESALQETSQRNLMDDYFGGVISNEIVCKDCPHSSQREERFMVLQLEVKGKHSIEESLKQYVNGEMLEGGNRYHCTKCNEKRDANKRASISSLPNVLILNLKRFEFDFEQLRKVKVNDYCEFPIHLDMLPYTSEGIRLQELAENSENVDETHSSSMETVSLEHPEEYYKYSLKGALVHSGTADSGHYYSYIKQSGTDNWFCFNDESVHAFDPRDLASTCFGGTGEALDVFQEGPLSMHPMNHAQGSAYLLFFERDYQETSSNLENGGAMEVDMQDNVKVPAGRTSCEEQDNNDVLSSNFPKDIREACWNENREFLQHQILLHPRFADFVYRLGELTMSQLSAVENRNSQTTSQAVVLLRMLSSTLVNLFVHGDLETVTVQLFCLLQDLTGNDTVLQQEFLKLVSAKDAAWIRIMLLSCPVEDLRFGFCSIIKNVLSSLVESERSQYSKCDWSIASGFSQQQHQSSTKVNGIELNRYALELLNVGDMGMDVEDMRATVCQCITADCSSVSHQHTDDYRVAKVQRTNDQSSVVSSDGGVHSVSGTASPDATDLSALAPETRTKESLVDFPDGLPSDHHVGSAIWSVLDTNPWVPSQSRSLRLMGFMLGHLPRVAPTGHRAAQYFAVMEHFASLGVQERVLLIKLGAITRLLDYYLNTDSPCDSYLRGAEVMDLWQPQRGSTSGVHESDSVISFASTLSLLVRTVVLVRDPCMDSSIWNKSGGEMNGTCEDKVICPTLTLPELYMIKQHQVIYQLLRDDCRVEDIVPMVKHLCWGRLELSENIVDQVIFGINKLSSARLCNFFTVFTEILELHDVHHDSRVEYAMDKFLLTIQKNQAYVQETRRCIEELINLVKNPKLSQVRTWLLQKHELWLEDWLIASNSHRMRQMAEAIFVALLDHCKSDLEVDMLLIPIGFLMDLVLESRLEAYWLKGQGTKSYGSDGESSTCLGSDDDENFHQGYDSTSRFPSECRSHLSGFFRILTLCFERGYMEGAISTEHALQLIHMLIRIDSFKVEHDVNKGELLKLIYTVFKSKREFLYNVLNNLDRLLGFYIVIRRKEPQNQEYNNEYLPSFYGLLESCTKFEGTADIASSSIANHTNFIWAIRNFVWYDDPELIRVANSILSVVSLVAARDSTWRQEQLVATLQAAEESLQTAEAGLVREVGKIQILARCVSGVIKAGSIDLSVQTLHVFSAMNGLDLMSSTLNCMLQGPQQNRESLRFVLQLVSVVCELVRSLSTPGCTTSIGAGSISSVVKMWFCTNKKSFLGNLFRCISIPFPLPKGSSTSNGTQSEITFGILLQISQFDLELRGHITEILREKVEELAQKTEKYRETAVENLNQASAAEVDVLRYIHFILDFVSLSLKTDSKADTFGADVADPEGAAAYERQTVSHSRDRGNEREKILDSYSELLAKVLILSLMGTRLQQVHVAAIKLLLPLVKYSVNESTLNTLTGYMSKVAVSHIPSCEQDNEVLAFWNHVGLVCREAICTQLRSSGAMELANRISSGQYEWKVHLVEKCTPGLTSSLCIASNEEGVVQQGLAAVNEITRSTSAA